MGVDEARRLRRIFLMMLSGRLRIVGVMRCNGIVFAGVR